MILLALTFPLERAGVNKPVKISLQHYYTISCHAFSGNPFFQANLYSEEKKGDTKFYEIISLQEKNGVQNLIHTVLVVEKLELEMETIY